MNRKNLYATLLLLSICLSPILSYSQVQIGVKGGLNLSNLYIDTDEIDDENAKIGFHAGAVLKLNITDFFAIQPEALFSTKGTTADYHFNGVNGEYDFNLNYVDVPVLAVVNLADILEIHAGPYFGFLINAKGSTDADLGPLGISENDQELNDDNFNKVDFGASIGAAIHFGTAQVGARYNIGLTDVQDSQRADFLLKDSKNQYAQLYVTFMLNDGE